MGRLSPPVVPDAAQRRVDITLEIPQEGIRRNEILAAYYPAMVGPLPDKKSVQDFLKSWAGRLSQAQWYRDTYPQTAIIFSDPSVPALPENAARVLQACNDHVDPLARYSAGWVDSLKELEPKGIRGRLSRALRDVGRYAAGQVVRAMAAEPGVRSSDEALEGFICDQSVRHDANEATALDAYLTKLAQVVAAGRGYGTVLTPADVQALNEYAEILNRLGAEDTALDDATVAEYHRKARLALEVIVREDHRLLNDDYLAVAFESLMTTYVNKLVNGESVDDFGPRIVWKRIKSRKTDEASKTMKEGESLDDDRPTAAPRVLTVPGDPTNALISVVRVIETAVGYLDADKDLRTDDGALCWEAEMVRAEFLSELKEDDRSNVKKRKFTPRVREAWTQQRPTNARSTSAVAAVMDCEMLLRTTLNRAQLDLENEFGGGDR